MDKKTGCENIAELLSEKYSKLYNSVSYETDQLATITNNNMKDITANNVSGEPPPPPPPPLHNPVRFPVENRRMEHSPANGEFCMYNGAVQHSPESNDGFKETKGTSGSRKDRK